MTTKPEVQFLQRSQGRVAWNLHGDKGPLVIGMPGMGDLRENWNGFAAALVAKGYRVAVLDLRSQGRSDVTFKDVSREAMAQYALALADSLSPETPVVLIGHSYTGASVVWASYYKSLFPVHPPSDLSARVEAVRANMKEPGRLASLRAMGHTTATACEARLEQVRRPTLIMFGSRDPDFPDAGHNPHADRSRTVPPSFDRTCTSKGNSMIRHSLDRASVVREAVLLADRDGCESLTLSVLAAHLGVKPPSLYNHIASLDALRRLMQLEALELFTARSGEAAMGHSGRAGLERMARTLFKLARKRPGVWAALQRALKPFEAVLKPMGLSKTEFVHLLRALRALVQGFASLEAMGGFDLPEAVELSFERALARILPA